MSYDIHFKARLADTEQWVSVGKGFINHTSNTAAMIKAVCGSYPSEWDGVESAKLLQPLADGITELRSNKEKYRQYEPENGWGTVETTIAFLEDVYKNCNSYPTAVVSVDY